MIGREKVARTAAVAVLVIVQVMLVMAYQRWCALITGLAAQATASAAATATSGAGSTATAEALTTAGADGAIGGDGAGPCSLPT